MTLWNVSIFQRRAYQLSFSTAATKSATGRLVTGWAQHTVRGFFAELKKRQGVTVEIAERILQVGPNKQSAKGSYTVYRVAE